MTKKKKKISPSDASARKRVEEMSQKKWNEIKSRKIENSKKPNKQIFVSYNYPCYTVSLIFSVDAFGPEKILLKLHCGV